MSITKVLCSVVLSCGACSVAMADCAILGQSVFGESGWNTENPDPFAPGFTSVMQDTGVVGPSIEIVLVDPWVTGDFSHAADTLSMYVNGSYAAIPFNGFRFELTDAARPTIVGATIDADSTFPGFDGSRLFYEDHRLALNYAGLAGEGIVVVNLVYEGAACPADLDGSADVGFGDILRIIGAWGACPPACPEDLSGNGNVDFADILAVIAAWGPC
ncbi:MAG: hypothetical protein GY715_15285 [Planctomycetes bacterium]|nr:hypothetical protein [Planctomycetota bacterium]